MKNEYLKKFNGFTNENYSDEEPQIIKWESLKSAVKRSIKNKLRSGSDVLLSDVGGLLLFFLSKYIKGEIYNVADKHKLISEIPEDLCFIVDNWDIRNASALFELYPQGIPTFIQNNNYVPELSDDGWILIEKI
jgi:hypothetical protein